LPGISHLSHTLCKRL